MGYRPRPKVDPWEAEDYVGIFSLILMIAGLVLFLVNPDGAVAADYAYSRSSGTRFGSIESSGTVTAEAIHLVDPKTGANVWLVPARKGDMHYLALHFDGKQESRYPASENPVPAMPEVTEEPPQGWYR